MVCIIDENNKIINIVDTDYLNNDNERPYYPWNGLWEEYNDEAPLEYVKQQKIAEIKNTRDTLEVADVEYNGNTYDFDDKSRMRLAVALKALQLQGASATIDWTLADNTTAVITANDILQVFAAAAVRSNELHQRYRSLKEQVSAAADKAAVEAINF